MNSSGITIKKHHILIIEDDITFANTITEILLLYDFDVTHASTADMAILLINQGTFDLILSDINLPGKNGYNILSLLRENVKTYRTPFIFLSGDDNMRDLRKSMQLGANDYLTKPVKTAELIDSINSKIEVYRNRTELIKKEIAQKAISEMAEHQASKMLQPLESIVNACFFIGTYPHQLNSNDIKDINREIYNYANRSLRNTRNLMLYNFAKQNKLVETDTFSNTLIISDLIQSILLYYNNGIVKTEPISGEDIEIIPLKCAKQQLEYVIFSELIDNAVRYNGGEHPPILSLSPINDDGYIFKITNNIPFAFYIDVNDIGPFRTIRNDQDNNGLGLGLFLVKELCKSLLLNFSLECSNGLFIVTVTKYSTEQLIQGWG